jgi:hypothetical protein
MDIFERLKAKREAKYQLWASHWEAMKAGKHDKAKEIAQTIFDQDSVKKAQENPIYSEGSVKKGRKTRSDKGKKRRPKA